MISAAQNISFTGVVPVRVFVDGMETFDGKLIKSSCNQLSKLLTNKKTNSPIITEFARYDSQYKSASFAEKSKPSDFFRCILDRRGAFLITGEQTQTVQKFGKCVGQEKQVCKTRKVSDSFDLFVAKKNYADAIADILSCAKLRFAEITDRFKPVTLNINMKSNGKYGLTTFKTKVESINFVS